MEPSDNPFASLRRKVALDIGNDENQDTQKDRDLNHIIGEKQKASSQPSGSVYPHPVQHCRN